MLPILTQTPHLSIVIGLPSTDDLFAGCERTTHARSATKPKLGLRLLFWLFEFFFAFSDERGPLQRIFSMSMYSLINTNYYRFMPKL